MAKKQIKKTRKQVLPRKPSLKAETIKGILTEGAFDMSHFGNLDELVRLKKTVPNNSCGTACCIAGHIVAAGTRLGIKAERGRIAAEYNKKNNFSRAEGLRASEVEVEEVAKDMWSRIYGKASAERLDFYGYFSENGDDLKQVTPEEAVAHLRSV